MKMTCAWDFKSILLISIQLNFWDRDNFEQRTKGPFPKCPLFGGSTVALNYLTTLCKHCAIIGFCCHNYYSTTHPDPSLVPRPLSDFISQPWRKKLRDKIWEWPEDKAIQTLLSCKGLARETMIIDNPKAIDFHLDQGSWFQLWLIRRPFYFR